VSGNFAGAIDLAGLDGSEGFVFNGIDAREHSEFSISSAGDVNGDGLDDILMGAFQADPNGLDDAGETDVVFGVEDLLALYDAADGHSSPLAGFVRPIFVATFVTPKRVTEEAHNDGTSD
jgi:hypothetical protein